MFSEMVQVFVNPIFPNDHSMGSDNFLRYVRSKITNEQFALLSIAVCNDFSIECHSFFDEDFDAFLKINELSVLSMLKPLAFNYEKTANFKRPCWALVEKAEGERCLIISVSPTREYLRQYSLIVQTAILFLCPKGQAATKYERAARAAAAMRVFYYPKIAGSFSDMLGLGCFLERTRSGNDVYIIGEGEKAFRDVIQHDGVGVVSHDALSFRVVDINLPGVKFRVRIVSVKHSFWGSAAGNVARVCAQIGTAKGVIYIAKLGAISARINIFDMVSPSRFLLWDRGKLRDVSAPPPFIPDEALHEMRIAATVHATLPTLVEETHVLLNHFAAFGAETVDNEIAFIAKEIAGVNEGLDVPVRFSCLHIVTDKPSSNVVADSRATKSIEVNHLLSKDDLHYRRLKQSHHRRFVSVLLRVMAIGDVV
ncbi:hypothetical protein [Pseudomonas japonica]|uniref:hypothetical protein n=1 Tax=Pseudomonas japonica TaxID=256466 RepID=UPI0015E32FC2|nr:hypothetical protein [Pseudomonas japonica]MBA1244866.1 hypothetical protein [Pseudomonas japonica]